MKIIALASIRGPALSCRAKNGTQKIRGIAAHQALCTMTPSIFRSVFFHAVPQLHVNEYLEEGKNL